MVYHHYRCIDDDAKRNRDSGKSVDMYAYSGKGINSKWYQKIDGQSQCDDEHIPPWTAYCKDEQQEDKDAKKNEVSDNEK